MEQHEKDTQDCLTIGYNEEGLECLKKVVAKYSSSDVCRPKLVLLVQDSCVPCKEETERFRADISKGVIKKINISSAEGMTIVKKNGIDAVPTIILVDCNDNIIMPV